MDRPHVEGEHHRVAERDYYENPIIIKSQPRRPLKPGLVPCPACGIDGLAPNALNCPGCGHDFTIARLQAYRLSQAKRGLANMTVIAVVLTVFNLLASSDAPLGHLNMFAVCTLWCGLAIAWLINWWRWR